MTVRRNARSISLLSALLLAATLLATPSGEAAAQEPDDDAPPVWTQADKDGILTSTTPQSPVYATLDHGRLTEVYYPRLDTPSVRSLELLVTDGSSFADVESEDTSHEIELIDNRSLLYRQVNTDLDGRYRITKTYVTDPRRPVVVIDVRFESLDGGSYDVYAYHDPQLDNTGRNDHGSTVRNALVARDGDSGISSALVARPRFAATSNGFEGSGGLEDLRDNFRLDDTSGETDGLGDVVQTGKLGLRRVRGAGVATLFLGFGPQPRPALAHAYQSLATRPRLLSAGYTAGWHEYLDSLPPRPRSVSEWPVHYDVSMMVLKATEDKSHPGAAIASPSMPWQWNDLSLHDPSGPYHLVWPRDLYHTATALLAAGDHEAAEHMADFLFYEQQEDDGSFPQNSKVTGEPFWTSEQLDETALPIVLAWQLDRDDPEFVRNHIQPAANFVIDLGPYTEQERWEEEEGFSPYAIATAIAGLVTAADLSRRVGDETIADLYLGIADRWADQVDDWAFTTTGPLGDGEYYLRINEDLDPDDGDIRELGNNAGEFDEREIVDPSFLELVRLGIKAPDNDKIVASLPELDADLKVETPNGPLWYRYSFDGYGETNDGEPWNLDTEGTEGRLWPLLSGERGEYAVAAGDLDTATTMLDTIARTANEGYMMPEQVWDRAEPTPRFFEFGEGTLSATPLGWTHGQFVRLAWSIERGEVVEMPGVVACRYVRECN